MPHTFQVVDRILKNDIVLQSGHLLSAVICVAVPFLRCSLTLLPKVCSVLRGQSPFQSSMPSIKLSLAFYFFPKLLVSASLLKPYDTLRLTACMLKCHMISVQSRSSFLDYKPFDSRDSLGHLCIIGRGFVCFSMQLALNKQVKWYLSYKASIFCLILILNNLFCKTFETTSSMSKQLFLLSSHSTQSTGLL